MKQTLLSLLSLLLITLSIQTRAQDTLHVTAMNDVNMTTHGSYVDTAVFPAAGNTYRRVWMHYTMGCASGGCSDWDYTTKINLLIPTGSLDSNIASIDTVSTSPLEIDTTWNVFPGIEKYELARVITPYGGNLSNGWQRDFVFDVTDFQYLLHDTVAVEDFYDGWSSGFSATVKFDFVEGTPAHTVYNIKNLYSGGTYNNHTQFEQDVLPAKTLTVPDSVSNVFLRTIFTGHGFDNSTNCGEFCQKSYHVLINNTSVANQSIWRDDCGWNPLYPQAGTWLNNRANWCPGLDAKIYTHNLTPYITPGTPFNFNINLDYISWTGNQAPSYIISAQLMTASAPAHQNDVAAVKILKPTMDFEQSRFNPVCQGAEVEIQNMGAQDLTSCTISYHVDGGQTFTYQWSGTLHFMETAEVTLDMQDPAVWTGTDAIKTFSFTVSNPNGVADEYPADNTLSSKFHKPDVFQVDGIIIKYKTNARPWEDNYSVTDENGNVLLEKTGSTLQSNYIYRDTLLLPTGCYHVSMDDSQGDGLYYSGFSNQGSGIFVIQNLSGVMLHGEDPNFGNGIRYDFSLENSLGLNQKFEPGSGVLLYPNPSSGVVRLQVNGNSNQYGWKVYSIDGRELETGTVNGNGGATLNLQKFGKGVYLLRVNNGAAQTTKRIVIE